MKNIIIIPFMLFLISACNQVKETNKHALYANNKNTNKFNTNMENSNIIQLPKPDTQGKKTFEQCLLQRRSVRNYKDAAFTIKEVSQLLWAAYGITKPIKGNASLRGGLKTAPSAGATYPLEVYILIGDIKEMEPGIYRYIPEKHSLELVIEGDKRQALCNAALGQEMIAKAPVSLVYTVVYNRITPRYGQRGKERYVCMETGHSAQNVYLQAVALNMGTCAVGAFQDNMVKEVLELTTDEEPLYILPVGKLLNED